MFADYHVHTEFSDDSVYPMEQVVRDAIAGGMDEICFQTIIEYENEQYQRLGSVVTNRGYSDWATTDIDAICTALNTIV